jgi:hypothetical protein
MPDEAYQTPILMLVFNRPTQTAKIFAAVRERRPARLYVAADGPRPERKEERQLCEQTRRICESVDWTCELKTLFREENLGCGLAVSEAISWFFAHESEGIILEDDCLPDPSFFPFCSAMLARFRENSEVGSISGNNFFPPQLETTQPYVFSKYVQIWGWATWRRFWEKYDFGLNGSLEEWKEIIARRNPNAIEARYWLEIFKAVASGLIDTWDYQVMFSAWRADVVHIYPGRNLVTNLGYGPDATHTNFASPMGQLERFSLRDFDVTLPVEINGRMDQGVFYYRFLEALSNTWWLEQALDLTEKIGWARWEIGETKRELNDLKKGIGMQSTLIRRSIDGHARKLYKINLTLLAAHLAFTLREYLQLARTPVRRLLAHFTSKHSWVKIRRTKTEQADKITPSHLP